MTQEQLLSYLHQNPFVLAPMAGITDSAFRSFMRQMGCGIVVTELVSAAGLKYNSAKTAQLMSFRADQHPVGVQLFGEDPVVLAEAARLVQDTGADFVDLNFGCPVAKVVKKGAGAAALRDLVQLKYLLRTVRAAIEIPLTIKIRTGWDDPSRNAHDVVKVAADEGVLWVAIHGRTRAQGYSGSADWDYIRYVKESSRIAVLGNGDVTSAQMAQSRLLESGCDGVLIGRGCLKDPWIFSDALALHNGKASEESVVERDYIPVMTLLAEHLAQSCTERILQIQMKKFAAWYSAGLPESTQFRKQLFTATEAAELRTTIFDYFQKWSNTQRLDTSHEPFLMGGHG
jgi:nifR3 family TIM-barrel protein